MITSPTRRIEIRDVVRAAEVQRYNMVCLHFFDCNFAATVSTASAEALHRQVPRSPSVVAVTYPFPVFSALHRFPLFFSSVLTIFSSRFMRVFA